ncbi:hypothetical protein GPJ56_004069 [Histomonas meleagridis]|uniref:uncharacterized protein n=1 Tax=Histomonas meleagridis TaxID=135588 RepID=UPI00355A73A9|nr:hypothetical protein GPJ56_004069 [Histomonas meleagridis]KAH0799466.1 hypothetical protein GO595_007721 [Histomonas meleagridis]
MEQGAQIQPKTFLDSICESVTGIKKIYISDIQGSILAESSGPQKESDITLVRSFPKYFDRLGKLGFGESQSMVIEGEDCSVVLISSSPLYLAFICEETANFALVQSLPDDMREFLGQPLEMRNFLEQIKASTN